MIRNYIKGFTHGRIMHADEVFAGAILRFIDKDFEIIRQKNRDDEIPNDENILVFDIGLGKFDHHQEEASLRVSGKKYSSVGLILREFWKDMGLTEDEYNYIDRSLIEKIDESDNYGTLCDYSTMIDYFNLNWTLLKDLSDEEIVNLENENYEKAVEFAKNIIKNELKYYRLGKKDNNFNSIVKIYNETLFNIANKKYYNNNISFIDSAKIIGTDILEKEVLPYFFEKINRFQNIFNKKNYKAGFVKVINCYNLIVKEEKEEALKLCKYILEKEISKALNEFLAKDFIEDKYTKSNANYIVLDVPRVPWMKAVTTINDVKNRKIDFIIYLNSDKTCGIQCVPKSFYLKNTKRFPFEEKIRGASIDVLTNYLDGLTFCHATGFYSVTKDLETAIKLIEKTTF